VVTEVEREYITNVQNTAFWSDFCIVGHLHFIVVEFSIQLIMFLQSSNK